ncbi:MAG TPA: hypothetical protein VJN94_15345 [Candidatus Binataceae bacterium]|nr:hypothetical protein [Candidatus Binataceae bacterium]
MNVGRDGLGIIKGASANEKAFARYDRVATPNVGAATLTKEYLMIPSAAGSQQERFWTSASGFHESPLDPDVDNEGAAGKLLTIAAMTGVNY